MSCAASGARLSVESRQSADGMRCTRLSDLTRIQSGIQLSSNEQEEEPPVLSSADHVPAARPRNRTVGSSCSSYQVSPCSRTSTMRSSTMRSSDTTGSSVLLRQASAQMLFQDTHPDSEDPRMGSTRRPSNASLGSIESGRSWAEGPARPKSIRSRIMPAATNGEGNVPARRGSVQALFRTRRAAGSTCSAVTQSSATDSLEGPGLGSVTESAGSVDNARYPRTAARQQRPGGMFGSLKRSNTWHARSVHDLPAAAASPRVHPEKTHLSTTATSPRTDKPSASTSSSGAGTRQASIRSRLVRQMSSARSLNGAQQDGGGRSPKRRGSWLGRGSPTGRRPTLSLPSAEAPTFLLRRRRKELEARKRAETKHEELVGMLLIRATEASATSHHTRAAPPSLSPPHPALLAARRTIASSAGSTT